MKFWKHSRALSLLLLLVIPMLLAAETVYDIQYTTDPSGDSPLVDQVVTVQGIVTATDYYSSGNSNRFFISDPEGGAWHGLFVFNYDYTVELGDEVEITGTVQEYYNFTELSDLTSLTILSLDNPIPEAVEITTAELASSEAYEGCLVKISGVETTSEAVSHGEWYVDDGSGECQIDDAMYEYPAIETGKQFESITGVVDYNFSEYGLNPRDANDFVEGTIPNLPVIEDIYTEPSTPTTDQEITVVAKITIESGQVFNPQIEWRSVTDVEGTWQTNDLQPYPGDLFKYTLLGLSDSDYYYEYKIRAEDSNGNSVESDIQTITLIDTESPVIESITVTPTEPTTGDAIEINTVVTDPDGNIDTVTLVWRSITDVTGDWQENQMNPEAGDVYSYTLAALTELSHYYEFKIRAEDVDSNQTESEIQPVNLADTVAPEIDNVAYDPTAPVVGEDITISATITDNSGIIEEAILHWQTVTDSPGDWETAEMSAQGGDLFSYTLPGLSSSDHYYIFKISSEDQTGNNYETPEQTINLTEAYVPVIKNIIITPDIPLVDGEITVSAEIVDSLRTITSAHINWRLITDDTGDWQTESMQNSGTIYSFVLDPIANTSHYYEFYLDAANDTGNIVESEMQTINVVQALEIANIVTSPSHLELGSPITITATITGYSANITGLIRWRQITDTPGNWQDNEMEKDGDQYSYTLPALLDKSYYYEFLIVAQDDQGNEIESEQITLDMTADSIYEIQYTTDPSGDSPFFGEVVEVSGIVTATGYYSSGNSNRFFLSDPEGGPWSGIFCFNYDYTVEVGDEVEFSAEVDEYFGFTELINMENFNIISSGNPVPEPIKVSTHELATQEAYEGCLVEVNAIEITSTTDGYGQWYVDDGSGECQIDDCIYEYPNVSMGEELYSIVGAVDYSYDEYGINPRGINDFIEMGMPIIESIETVPVYPLIGDTIRVNTLIAEYERQIMEAKIEWRIVTDETGDWQENAMIPMPGNVFYFDLPPLNDSSFKYQFTISATDDEANTVESELQTIDIYQKSIILDALELMNTPEVGDSLLVEASVIDPFDANMNVWLVYTLDYKSKEYMELMIRDTVNTEKFFGGIPGQSAGTKVNVGVFAENDSMSIYFYDLEFYNYPVKSHKAVLKVPPHPFDPYQRDGDPDNDTMLIEYFAQRGDRVIMRIYNSEGKLMLTPENKYVTSTNGYNTYEWDGRDKNHELLNWGLYICHIEVLESESGDVKTAQVPIVIGGPLK